MRTQSHWLRFLHANLCLYPSSSFCLHGATETALTKLSGDVFAFPVLLVLIPVLNIFEIPSLKFSLLSAGQLLL